MRSSATLRVVCFDDDFDAASRLATRLDRDGIEADPTSTMTTTLERLEGGDVDCVVVSYRLGHEDGSTAITRLRRSWPSLSLVLYGKLDSREIPLATATSADDYVDTRDVDALCETIRDTTGRAVDIDESPYHPSDHYVEFESIAVHKSELFDEIFECLPVHMYIKDESSRHVAVSQAFHDPDVFLGRRDDEIPFAPDEHTRSALGDDRTVLREGQPILDTEEYLPGHDRWNLSSKVPLFDPNGNTIGLLGVTRDITRQKEAQRELERQNDRLEQFAEFVSHDLRNPLSIATASVELERETRDSGRLADAAAALERMADLIEEVLALAKHGRTVVDAAPETVESVLERAERALDSDGVTVDVGDGDLEIVADETRLQRLFENLLSNAVDHAGAGTTITVGATAQRDGFYLADDGPGIPREHRSGVFEPGWTDSDSGTGFGLAIVREIAEAHGWSVDLSESAAGGVRFEFTGVELVSYEE
ncbi:ATP-binding protein [Natrarchaeobius sp. A-rgal3]|uniref:ATP-binding protein n=1 Tax=Natrarchaeobius versutus TaxID=1679078 RepID=UPI0035104196